MLDIHAAALKSPNPIYHEFLQSYKASAKVVYGFVEGKDDPMFYKGFIEHSIPNDWIVTLIKAGNKKNVLMAYSFFDWARFSREQICFFVDRDLSEFIQEDLAEASNLYITDHYSIENDVVNVETFKRTMTEIFNVGNLTNNEIEIIENNFSAALSTFQQAITPVMTQIIIWRRNNLKIKLNLNNIEPKEFFSFVNGNISLKSNYVALESRLNYVSAKLGLTVSQLSDLSNMEQEFLRKDGAKKFIRGKYLLWFFIQFSLDFYESIPSILPSFEIPPKLKVSIGLGNAIIFIAPRARCPSSLKMFINKNYEKHINSVTKKTQ